MQPELLSHETTFNTREDIGLNLNIETLDQIDLQILSTRKDVKFELPLLRLYSDKDSNDSEIMDEMGRNDVGPSLTCGSLENEAEDFHVQQRSFTITTPNDQPIA